VSTGTVPAATDVQTLEPDTVELHVRNVPQAVWLRARHAALASRLRFGQYVIRLLEQAEPFPPKAKVQRTRGEHSGVLAPNTQTESAAG